MKRCILIVLALTILVSPAIGQSIINQIGNAGSDSYRVRNGPTNASDLFIIRGSTGNLGIGTVFPTQKFHIFGAGNQSFLIESSGDRAALMLDGNNNDGFWTILNPFDSRDLRFHVTSTLHGNGSRMTIKSDGKVGIGTAVPSEKLQVVGTIKASSYSGDGSNLSFTSDSNMQPSQAINFIIALTGVFPSRNKVSTNSTAPQGSDPLLGEIILFAGNFAPRGWAFCNGQLLHISSYQSLYSLLGTNFGGDGRTTFGLPDLRGRVPIHSGGSAGPGLTNRPIGQKLGRETINQ